MTQNAPLLHFNTPFTFSMGPQRAGTSWLDRYLRTRGDICLPSKVKEIFYFDKHFQNGANFYKSHFAPNPQKHKMTMEISTTAFDSPEAPHRVKETLGSKIKFLCPLRDPVMRSHSLYLHYLRYGMVNPNLEEASRHTLQIIEGSRYSQHIQNWMSVFGEDNIHFVFQEDLENNQENYIEDICTILNVPHIPAPQDMRKKYNATTYSKSGTLAITAQRSADWLRKHRLYPVINTAKSMGLKPLVFGKENPDSKTTDIPPEDLEFLQAHLHQEIEKLESLIGPIPQWKKLHQNTA